MRLKEGIFVKKEETFSGLRFSALRREVQEQDDNGQPTGVIKERTYDLKCRSQGMMIQVSLPAEIPLKEFDFNAEVDLVNPVLNAVASAGFPNVEVDWYLKADDIILKGRQPMQSGKPQTPPQQGNEKKPGAA